MADYGSYDDGYENEEQFDDGAGEVIDEDAITPEDCWTVISSFFDVKGLVSQQVDSFNEFTTITVQSLIDEYSQSFVDQENPTDDSGRDIAMRRYEINFGRVMISKPTLTEANGTTTSLLPYECRDRNLTYSAPIYCKVTKRVRAAVNVPIL